MSTAFDLATLTKIDELIEKSSLGTDGARQLRRRTSAEIADRLVEQVASTTPTLATPELERMPLPEPVNPPDSSDVAPVQIDPFAEIVRRAQAGDQQAVEDLIAQIRPLIVRYCRARIAQSTYYSADDVAQDACLAVLNALPSYRPSGSDFLGFVYGITTHKIIDFHRRYSRERSTPVADVPDGVMSNEAEESEHQLLRAELGKQLAALLRELPQTQRDVLRLRLVVGLSTAETAETLSISPGAVRVCQHRALTNLRNRLRQASD